MPISERFVEFVTHMFRNSAFQMLYRSIVCRPDVELCAQSQVSVIEPDGRVVLTFACSRLA